MSMEVDSDGLRGGARVVDLTGYDYAPGSNPVSFSGSSQPDEHECLYCYLDRVLQVFGCDGLTFTTRWITSRRRPHKWVLRWVEANGGFCDCEVILNALRDGRTSRRFHRLRCAASQVDHEETYDDEYADDGGEPTSPIL